jgi:hypothetical protein
MGFAMTEFAAGGVARNFSPRRAARDPDLLRYFINSVPRKVGLRCATSAMDTESVVKP